MTLQKSLICFRKLLKDWKLSVNTYITKVAIFTKNGKLIKKRKYSIETRYRFSQVPTNIWDFGFIVMENSIGK